MEGLIEDIVQRVEAQMDAEEREANAHVVAAGSPSTAAGARALGR